MNLHLPAFDKILLNKNCSNRTAKIYVTNKVFKMLKYKERTVQLVHNEKITLQTIFSTLMLETATQLNSN